MDGVRAVEVAFTALPPRERAALADRLKATAPPLTGGLGNRTRIYAVASGKGGVGKSTVTANLAVALAATGQRVGVLDADVWGYSMPQLFGVRRNPVVLGEMMLPVPAHGVGLMSVGFFVHEEQPVVWRGPMLHKALAQFVSDTYWGSLDALLVDMPPGTGDATLSLLELLPDTALLAVTTPQTTARVVAARVARMAAETGVPAGRGHREHVRRRVRPLRGTHRRLRQRRRRDAGRRDRRTPAGPGAAGHGGPRGGRPRRARRRRRARGRLGPRADPDRGRPARPPALARAQSASALGRDRVTRAGRGLSGRAERHDVAPTPCGPQRVQARRR